MRFELENRDTSSSARTGRLEVIHGTIETPAFAPVGTSAAVKGVPSDRLMDCGSQFVLANAYHLELQPGSERIQEQGGLHRFMGWDRPILTDSGGYQVFSLSELREINSDGVEFRSPRDGSLMFLGPKEAIEIQGKLGSDIAMTFDECPPCPCSRETAEAAVDRTLKWAEMCKETHSKKNQALFGIVQGGEFEQLRKDCAECLEDLDFDGYAIGGVSVGEDKSSRRKVVGFTTPMLPEEKPRYLMGVGFPSDLLHAVGQGLDLFDCVAPSRMGRNATAFTEEGRLRLRNSAFQDDKRPIEEACDCLTCRLYSRAYLSHLFRAQEMLGPILLTIHNIQFYHRMMLAARDAINANSFASFCSEFLSRYAD